MQSASNRFIEFLYRILSISLLAGLFSVGYRDILPLPVLPLCVLLVSLFFFIFPQNELRTHIFIPLTLIEVFLLLQIPHLPTFLGSPLAYNRFYIHYTAGLPLIMFTAFFTILTTQAHLRLPRYKIIEPFFFIIVAAIFFIPDAEHAMTIFPHPVYKAVFAAIFLFLQFIYLSHQNSSSKKNILFIIVFATMLFLSFFVLIKKYNEASTATNGGLIRPTLFRFDFSPYLTLQNEITINDNLVLIAHTSQEYSTTFLRRMYLAGWDPEKGFFEVIVPGEPEQQTRVPSRPETFFDPSFSLRNSVKQEIYTVNLDPQSLIAFDYPISVEPFRVWNASSFSGAYRVTSKATGFIPFELFSVKKPTSTSKDGLSPESFAFYTKIDPKTRALIEPLALDISINTETYYDTILALTSFLHQGEYRYSLKPGIASDGNQLSHFLFTSKKGYCTYFAFSLALMLRTLDIPSRVAAGFFLQPDSSTLDYYPVRSNMAHAWVEVFFPDYGWISFDPTTTMIAEGEDLNFSDSPGGEEFNRLLEEILSHREEGFTNGSEINEEKSHSGFSKFFTTIKNNSLFITVLILILFSIVFSFFYSLWPRITLHLTSNNRRKILIASALSKRHYKKDSSAPDNIQSSFNLLKILEQKARYAPVCSLEDAQKAIALAFVLIRFKKKGNDD